MQADNLQVTLVIEAGEDDGERDASTTKLRRELLRLDVAAVERPTAGDAPAGTRGFGVAEIGTLIVTVAKRADVIGPIVAAVRSWLATRGSGIVKIQIGHDSIELTASAEQQDALVAAWIRAHEPR